MINFIKKALSSNNPESSKRLIGFLAFLVICSFGYIAIWRTIQDKEILTQVISVLGIIVGGAIGGTVLEKVAEHFSNYKKTSSQNKNNNTNENNTSEQ